MTQKKVPTMTIESMIAFIYSHSTATGYAMPFNKMYPAMKSFLESVRKPSSIHYDGRQVETATFTMTLFSVLYAASYHVKRKEIVALFLENLVKVASEPSLPNISENKEIYVKHNLVLYFDYIDHYVNKPSFRGIVPTTYDFSMEEEHSVYTAQNSDTIYFNALSVSLYAFVHALKEYEEEPRPLVSLFFARNAQLEKISDSQIYKNFCETPMWMDMVIDY